MPYPSAFFALMTHKSVTCAMFPNKLGVPLTEKIKYTCTFFWRRDLPTFFFLAHEYFTRFVCVVCFPAQVSSFAAKFSLGAWFQNLLLQPHPHPQYPPPRASPYRHLKPPPPQSQLQPHLCSARIQSGNPPISITAPAWLLNLCCCLFIYFFV